MMIKCVTIRWKTVKKSTALWVYVSHNKTNQGSLSHPDFLFCFLCKDTKMVANDTYAEQREDDIHGVDFLA